MESLIRQYFGDLQLCLPSIEKRSITKRSRKRNSHIGGNDWSSCLQNLKIDADKSHTTGSHQAKSLIWSCSHTSEKRFGTDGHNKINQLWESPDWFDVPMWSHIYARKCFRETYYKQHTLPQCSNQSPLAQPPANSLLIQYTHTKHNSWLQTLCGALIAHSINNVAFVKGKLCIDCCIQSHIHNHILVNSSEYTCVYPYSSKYRGGREVGAL